MDDEYRNHKIRYNSDHRFTVIGPHCDNQGSMGYDSYRQAQQAIDDAVAVHVKSEEKKLDMKVVGIIGKFSEQKVVDLTVKGIHAGTQSLLFVESLDGKEQPNYVYPRREPIRALLTELVILRKKMAEIDKQLDRYGIRTNRGYGRLGKTEKLIEAVNKLQEDFVEKICLVDDKYKTAS